MRISSFMLQTVAASLVLVFPATAAEVVEIKWDGKRFAHSASIPPGKFAEACGKLKKGEEVDWSFNAEKPTDFNIHYHVGDKVEYPDKRDGVATLKARLKAPVDQDYCWMWKNNNDAPVGVKVELSRR